VDFLVAGAGRPCRGDVLVADLMSAIDHRVGQPQQRARLQAGRRRVGSAACGPAGGHQNGVEVTYRRGVRARAELAVVAVGHVRSDQFSLGCGQRARSAQQLIDQPGDGRPGGRLVHQQRADAGQVGTQRDVGHDGFSLLDLGATCNHHPGGSVALRQPG
jgi:hypothetical protein